MPDARNWPCNMCVIRATCRLRYTAVQQHEVTRHDATRRDPSRFSRRPSCVRKPTWAFRPFVTDHSVPICPVTEIRKRLESDANSRPNPHSLSLPLFFSLSFSPWIPLALLSNLRFTLADPRTYRFIPRFMHYHNEHRTYLPATPDFSPWTFLGVLVIKIENVLEFLGIRRVRTHWEIGLVITVEFG